MEKELWDTQRENIGNSAIHYSIQVDDTNLATSAAQYRPNSTTIVHEQGGKSETCYMDRK